MKPIYNMTFSDITSKLSEPNQTSTVESLQNELEQLHYNYRDLMESQNKQVSEATNTIQDLTKKLKHAERVAEHLRDIKVNQANKIIQLEEKIETYKEELKKAAEQMYKLSTMLDDTSKKLNVANSKVRNAEFTCDNTSVALKELKEKHSDLELTLNQKDKENDLLRQYATIYINLYARGEAALSRISRSSFILRMFGVKSIADEALKDIEQEKSKINNIKK